MKTCVLIPVLNEARTIGPIVEAIHQKRLDVLVIDDGSSDRSGAIARSKGAEVIRHDTRSGKGASMRDGFNHILNKNYDGVIVMDGDGQHDVDEIEAFLKAAQAHLQTVIVGNRMHDVKDMPFIRVMTNKFMSGLISLSCGVAIPDTQCGYRYIPMEILRRLNLASADYEIETEILIKTRKLGFSIRSVPIKTIYAQEVSHIQPVRDTFRFINYYFRETFFSQNKKDAS